MGVSVLSRPDLFWPTERVAEHLRDPKVRIVDCRFSFDADARADYLKGHLPGAVHVNWAEDLSAPPPFSGHPRWLLAGPEDFARAMSRLGIGDDTMVVGYDAEGGHHAARLWLGLRRYGPDRMAVMEGGIQKWQREGRPTEAGEVRVAAATFTPSRSSAGAVKGASPPRSQPRAGAAPRPGCGSRARGSPRGGARRAGGCAGRARQPRTEASHRSASSAPSPQPRAARGARRAPRRAAPRRRSRRGTPPRAPRGRRRPLRREGGP